MNIEADARRNVIEAILICRQIQAFEDKQKRKGKVFFSNNEEYNELRAGFLREISAINSVANVFGQGRDDLNADVLLAVDEVARKVSASQSKAVRDLCEKIQS